MLKKTIRTVLMTAVASGALVFAAGCSEDIEGNEQTHPTYVKAKQAREASKYQEAADLLNDLLSKAPNSAFLHRELAQLYGDNLYDYNRAIYHYERHLELAKTLSEEDRKTINSYIELYKKKAAEQVNKAYPQPVPKPEVQVVDNPAALEEKDKEIEQLKKEIEQLKDENVAKHNQYLKLFTMYSEARNKLVEYAENSANAEPGDTVTVSRVTNNGADAEEATVTDAGDHLIYVVQSGDYPGTIAKKHGIKVRDLMKANGLTEESARRIKVGQKLKIPKK